MGARVVTLPRRIETSEPDLPRLRELELEAEKLWDEGDVDGAIKQWSDIVRQDPGRSTSRRRMAKALMVAERWEEASRQLNLCLTLAPGSAGVTAELGVCYLHLDQLPNALLLLRESLRLEPGMRLASAAMDSFLEDALPDADASIERGVLRYQPPQEAVQVSATNWARWIDCALSSETEMEAAECLSDILLIAPECTQALYELARLHDLTGRTGWASRYYERAMRCDPQAWQPYFNLARLHATEGDHTSARPLLERAVLLCPGEFAPCWLLAQVCEQLDDRNEARFWFMRAKALAPAEAEVEVALARLCGGDAKSELFHLEAAMRLGCDRVEVLFNLGFHLWRAGRLEDARSTWLRAGLPEAIHACAALAFEASEHTECSRLLDLHPHPGLLAILAKTFAERGEVDRAIECYRAAVAAGGDCAKTWLNLGALLAAKGLPCTEEWQSALRLDPALASSYFDGV